MISDRSSCLSEVSRILAMKQGKPGTKLILILLTLHPEGLTIYDMLDLLGLPDTSRRVLQRQLAWPIATGQIVTEAGKGRRNSVAVKYMKGKAYVPVSRKAIPGQSPGPR